MREGSIAHRPISRALLIFTLVALVAAAFWYSRSIQTAFYATVERLEVLIRRHPLPGAAAFVSLAGLSAMLSPFSSIPLIPAAVVIWGRTATVALLLGGWLVGHTATYAIGRSAGYVILKRLVDVDRIDHYRTRLDSRSGFLLVLLFRLAMPAEIPGYVLGSLRYHLGKYAAATVIAELPIAIVAVTASNALLARRPAEFLGWVAALLAATGITFYALHRRLDAERPAR